MMSLIVIAFLSGICLFQQLPELPSLYWFWALGGIIALLGLSNIWRIMAIIGLGFFWAFGWASGILSSSLPAGLEGKDVQIEGRVVALPDTFKRRVRFEMEVVSLHYQGQAYPSPGRIRLNWYQYSTATKLRTGERWRLVVRLKRPHGFMNPGGFDYEGWLFQHRIRATGYVRDNNSNQRLQIGSLWRLDVWRERLGEQLNQVLGDRPYKGIIIALAIGDRSGITSEQWDQLKATGINHLVAISGLHIGLVAGLAFYLSRRMWAYLGPLPILLAAPKAAAGFGIGAALFYAALAGFAIPTQRALAMVCVLFGAIWLSRKFSMTQLLAIAGGVVLLMDPLAVMAPGFWLSFAAVGILIYAMSGRLRASRWWQWGRVHLVIALGLLPILLTLFGQFSVVSPLANALAVPWVSFFVVPLTLLGTSLLMINQSAGAFLLSIAHAGFDYLWQILSILASADASVWSQHMPLTWTVLLGILGVIVLLSPLSIRYRWVGIIYLLPLFWVKPDRPAQGEFWFTLLDVGQGLAAVAQTRDHILVFDTGAKWSDRFNAGEAVIVPALRQWGVDKIDTLVLSHGDNDHIGGTSALLKAWSVGDIYTSFDYNLAVGPTKRCRTSIQWEWNEVHFAFLHPSEHYHSRQENNLSCVLKITTAEYSVLLTGDIEASAETYLLRQDTKVLASDILIAPHHGSRTSSSVAFIEAVSPQWVLFPVGYRNRYGFPKPQVLERYQRHQVIDYRSSVQGAITFKLHVNGIETPVLYRQQQQRYWHQ